jgi:hypothetical protein
MRSSVTAALGHMMKPVHQISSHFASLTSRQKENFSNFKTIMSTTTMMMLKKTKMIF